MAKVQANTKIESTAPPPMWKGFLQGSVGAMVGGAAAHPLDVLKVRMQIQGEGVVGARLNSFGMATQMVAKEGVTSLYDGLTASLLRQCIYSGSRFGMYDAIKMHLTNGDPTKALSFQEKVGAGLFSGAFGAAIANPCDVSMVRMQADGKLPLEQRRNYKNVFDAFARISSEEGIGTMWRGTSATVMRGMLVTVGQVSCYDAFKEFYINVVGMSSNAVTTHFAGALSAAFAASVLSNPVDVAKTRMMNMAVNAETGLFPYSGPVDCILKTSRAEGLTALYKGFAATFSRQCPFVIVTWITVEQLKKVLSNY